eukprot:scaffold93021_cov54-Phaeocystis_antarctica.AAC.1
MAQGGRSQRAERPHRRHRHPRPPCQQNGHPAGRSHNILYLASLECIRRAYLPQSMFEPHSWAQGNRWSRRRARRRLSVSRDIVARDLRLQGMPDAMVQNSWKSSTQGSWPAQGPT